MIYGDVPKGISKLNDLEECRPQLLNALAHTLS
jgi:hypothetical protein